MFLKSGRLLHTFEINFAFLLKGMLPVKKIFLNLFHFLLKFNLMLLHEDNKKYVTFSFSLIHLQSLSKRIHRLDRHVMECKHFEYCISGSDFTQVKQERVSNSCCYQTGATVSPVRSMEHSAHFPKAKYHWLRSTAATSDTNWNILRLSRDRERRK